MADASANISITPQASNASIVGQSGYQGHIGQIDVVTDYHGANNPLSPSKKSSAQLPNTNFVLFEGVAISHPSMIGVDKWEVRVDKVHGGSHLGANIVWVIVGGLSPELPKGYFDPRIKIGDKVYVAGNYDPGSQAISLYGNTGYHMILFPEEKPANQPPTVSSLTTDKPSSQVAGTVITFIAYASDPDKDTIFYRFLLNGPATSGNWRDETGWTTSNIWTWSASENDAGQNAISVQVRDGKHADENGYDSSSGINYGITKKQAGPQGGVVVIQGSVVHVSDCGDQSSHYKHCEFDVKIDKVLKNDVGDPKISPGSIVTVYYSYTKTAISIQVGECVEISSSWDTKLYCNPDDSNDQYVREISCSEKPTCNPEDPNWHPGIKCTNNVVYKEHLYPNCTKQWEVLDDCNAYNPPRKCMDDRCVEEAKPSPVCNQIECEKQNHPIGVPYTKEDGKTYQKYTDCKCTLGECKCDDTKEKLVEVSCKEVKFQGTAIEKTTLDVVAEDMKDYAAPQWKVKIETKIEGSPQPNADSVYVYVGYKSKGAFDQNINKGDKVEVFGCCNSSGVSINEKGEYYIKSLKPTPKCDQAACQAESRPVGVPFKKEDGMTYQRYQDCKCKNEDCSCEGTVDKVIEAKNEVDIKFKGIYIKEDQRIGAKIDTIQIGTVLEGPQISGKINITNSISANPKTLIVGSLDPNLQNGDEVEVYAKYESQLDSSASNTEKHEGSIIGDKKYYIRKISQESKGRINFTGKIIDLPITDPRITDAATYKVEVESISPENINNVGIHVGDDVIVSLFDLCPLNEGQSTGTLIQKSWRKDPPNWNPVKGDEVEVCGNAFIPDHDWPELGIYKSVWQVDLCGSNLYYIKRIERPETCKGTISGHVYDNPALKSPISNIHLSCGGCECVQGPTTNTEGYYEFCSGFCPFTAYEIKCWGEPKDGPFGSKIPNLLETRIVKTDNIGNAKDIDFYIGHPSNGPLISRVEKLGPPLNSKILKIVIDNPTDNYIYIPKYLNGLDNIKIKINGIIIDVDKEAVCNQKDYESDLLITAKDLYKTVEPIYSTIEIVTTAPSSSLEAILEIATPVLTYSTGIDPIELLLDGSSKYFASDKWHAGFIFLNAFLFERTKFEYNVPSGAGFDFYLPPGEIQSANINKFTWTVQGMEYDLDYWGLHINSQGRYAKEYSEYKQKYGIPKNPEDKFYFLWPKMSYEFDIPYSLLSDSDIDKVALEIDEYQALKPLSRDQLPNNAMYSQESWKMGSTIAYTRYSNTKSNSYEAQPFEYYSLKMES
jgi:hypothetical protein